MPKLNRKKKSQPKVDGIVLAAGFSSRTGSHKMLLPLGETTIIEKCVEGLLSVCSQVIVVGGYRIEDIAQILNKYPCVEVIFNPDFREGMFNSIKAGIKHVNNDHFFLIPGDYPLISSSVYINMLQNDGDIIIPVYRGIKGHPVLIKSSLIGQILNSREHSLKEYINNKGFSTVNVEEPGVLIDVDTLEDYYKVCRIIDSRKALFTKALIL
jgi:molybdenum cofactor cytidylyltransferase